MKPLNKTEKVVLKCLAGYYSEGAYYFRGIMENTGLNHLQTKRACRALRLRGLAEHMLGLFDDDGMIAGSGYAATKAGYEISITVD